MFVQIHMLQSVPPGNLNRDEKGWPKKCIFGGVTRGRISSQCLKRTIRRSVQFEEAFGDARSVRTTYLPRMVADELKKLMPGISEAELEKIKAALSAKFKAETRKGEAAEAGEGEEPAQPQGISSDQTGQLVFFPQPFTREIARLLLEFMSEKGAAFKAWTGGNRKEKEAHQPEIKELENEIFRKSESLTVDIGMFGRMTTSDLVVNIEAACQVAHAISTHEVIIESDYFTAMDDKKAEFALTQTEKTGAAYLGSGENVTYFDSAVYYKYLNLDVDALKMHLSWNDDEAANAAGVLARAATLANPTGKQNSFAAHGLPDLILVEASRAKLPISYANAFLKPVDGIDLMSESAKALEGYVNTVAKPFAPKDTGRSILAMGSAAGFDIEGAKRVATLDELVGSLVGLVKEGLDGRQP